MIFNLLSFMRLISIPFSYSGHPFTLHPSLLHKYKTLPQLPITPFDLLSPSSFSFSSFLFQQESVRNGMEWNGKEKRRRREGGGEEEGEQRSTHLLIFYYYYYKKHSAPSKVNVQLKSRYSPFPPPSILSLTFPPSSYSLL